MTRRFPLPWSVDELEACLVVKDRFIMPLPALAKIPERRGNLELPRPFAT